MFRYNLEAASRPIDPYYYTNWRDAVPISVVAENKQAAISRAATALGDPGEHSHWVFRLRDVVDAHLTEKEAEK